MDQLSNNHFISILSDIFPEYILPDLGSRDIKSLMVTCKDFIKLFSNNELWRIILSKKYKYNLNLFPYDINYRKLYFLCPQSKYLFTLSIKHNDLDFIRLGISLGMEPEMNKNKFIKLASKHNKIDIIKYLLDNGLKLKRRLSLLLTNAIRNDSSEMIELLSSYAGFKCLQDGCSSSNNIMPNTTSYMYSYSRNCVPVYFSISLSKPRVLTYLLKILDVETDGAFYVSLMSYLPAYTSEGLMCMNILMSYAVLPTTNLHTIHFMNLVVMKWCSSECKLEYLKRLVEVEPNCINTFINRNIAECIKGNNDKCIDFILSYEGTKHNIIDPNSIVDMIRNPDTLSCMYKLLEHKKINFKEFTFNDSFKKICIWGIDLHMFLDHVDIDPRRGERNDNEYLTYLCQNEDVRMAGILITHPRVREGRIDHAVSAACEKRSHELIIVLMNHPLFDPKIYDCYILKELMKEGWFMILLTLCKHDSMKDVNISIITIDPDLCNMFHSNYLDVSIKDQNIYVSPHSQSEYIVILNEDSTNWTYKPVYSQTNDISTSCTYI